MNSRERLKDIAFCAHNDLRKDGLVAMSRKDAAALRELDQLLEICTGLIKISYGTEGIYKRLRQAGYGEK